MAVVLWSVVVVVEMEVLGVEEGVCQVGRGVAAVVVAVRVLGMAAAAAAAVVVAATVLVVVAVVVVIAIVAVEATAAVPAWLRRISVPGHRKKKMATTTKKGKVRGAKLRMTT